jgi:hypothetical protein
MVKLLKHVLLSCPNTKLKKKAANLNFESKLGVLHTAIFQTVEHRLKSNSFNKINECLFGQMPVV